MKLMLDVILDNPMGVFTEYQRHAAKEELTTLRKQLEASQADAARLDWLCEGLRSEFSRESIDAAMRKETKV